MCWRARRRIAATSETKSPMPSPPGARVPDDPPLRLRVRRQARERYAPRLGIAEQRERALLRGRLRLHQRERLLLLVELPAEIGDRLHLLGERSPQPGRLARQLIEAHFVARADPARAHHGGDARGERHARHPPERLAGARAAGGGLAAALEERVPHTRRRRLTEGGGGARERLVVLADGAPALGPGAGAIGRGPARGVAR